MLCPLARHGLAGPAGRQARCDNASGTIAAVAGINENFGIFPNPTTGALRISYKLSNTENGEVEIGGLLGQLVQTINLANAVPGLYLLQLEDSRGRIFTLKFSKQ